MDVKLPQGTGTATGTDTYEVENSVTLSAYVDKGIYLIDFTNPNTGASTLEIDGLGAKAIVNKSGDALGADDIKDLNVIVYDLGNDRFVSLSIHAAISGGVTFKGGYDADTNTPDLDTSPSGVVVGDMYTVTVAGTFFATPLDVGDVLISEIDDPATIDDWTILEKNLIQATPTVAGYIKTAVTATVDTGTATDEAITPDALNGSAPVLDGTNFTNVTRIILSDYIIGSTGGPSTTATTSGTAPIIAEMTKTFTPVSASNKIEVQASCSFSNTGDENARMGVFIDGVLEPETEVRQYANAGGPGDFHGSLFTFWQGTHATSEMIITIRMWTTGGTLTAIGVLRNMLVKEITE